MDSDAAKPLNVLIVEDDIGDRKLLHQLLRKTTLNISDVKFADRLNTTIELLEEGDYDVIFLDLGLPDSQGLDSVNTLNTKAPNTPIIVLSGLDDAEMGVTAVQKGVEDYLVKGRVDNNLLTRTVRYAIERKRTKIVLDEKQKNIEAVFDAAPIGMMLIDEHMMVKRVNNAIRQMLQKDYNQIINQPFGNALGCINTVNNGKDCGNNPACELCKLHQTVETILSSKQLVREVEAQHTFNIDNKQITLWLLISGEPAIIDGRNHAVIAISDITDSKNAARERQLAEDKYRTIFENSAVAISMADEQERLISWNKFMEDLLGMGKEDLYLKPVRSLYPEGNWKTIRGHNVRRKGMQHHLETQMVKKNGELIDVDVSLSVLKNPEGKVIGSIGVIRDITERLKAERELKETMEMRSQFMSTVSHELRTPLTSIKEAITIVADEVAGKINKDQKNFLEIAKRNIDRLSRLIDEVLDFQKLSANKMKFHLQENDIMEVVNDVYNTMAPFAKKSKITLSIKTDSNLPKFKFDNDRMIQVLTNLISNAIKFTPEKGSVTVQAQQQGEYLAVMVSDTGMGMPKEALPKIFDQFYRVHNPNQQIKGTGLGLSIVNKIVQAHRGRIEVESEVGKGTTFTIFLPLSSEATPEVIPEEEDKVLENAIAANQANTP
jgi:PAS domain S-box-containing protein